VVESTALEMRRACEGTVGSNPTLSAIFQKIRDVPGLRSGASSFCHYPSLNRASRHGVNYMVKLSGFVRRFNGLTSFEHDYQRIFIDSEWKSGLASKMKARPRDGRILSYQC
jgi:hypothetical protein